MKDPRDYLTNTTPASTGFSIGRLKDDPGDGTGSGATVQTVNDLLYAEIAPIIKYVGAVSETDESEIASDHLTAIERAAGVANENVVDWANATVYAQDDHVMYLGCQYVSMIAANSGNNPIDNPTKWLPCFGRDEILRTWRDGHDIQGGFAPLHNVRDGTYYRQYFKWGRYNFGGAAGRNYQAYGVHLEGQTLTGNATYEAIFKIGVTGQYHLLDVIAPVVGAIRSITDARGRVPRCIDASSGGRAVAVGLAQEDQMQGHWHKKLSAGGIEYLMNSARITAGTLAGLSASGSQMVVEDPSTDGTNGTPRVGAETRMKNYSVGLPSVLVLVEI
jgi:hypothetical protein